MPSRNTRNRSSLLPHHIYNRARLGRNAFVDNHDRDTFRDLLACRLSRSTVKVDRRYRNTKPVEGVQLFAMCLMTTHFHLVIWQKQNDSLRCLMQGLISSYTRYFNRRHDTAGPLFDGEYRARPLSNPKDLCWAIAYVHDNHPSGLEYRYSTHGAYLRPDDCPGWLNTKTPLKYFGGVDGYRSFLANRDRRAELNHAFF